MASDLRLLIIDDSPFDAQQMVDALVHAKVGIDSWCAATEEQLVRALGVSWDLVIMEYGFAGLTFERVLAMVRDHLPQAAVLVVSDRVDEEKALDLMRRGATDCLNKTHMNWLAQTVLRTERDRIERSARLRAEEQVTRLGRMYRVLSETNQAIVRIADNGALLDEVCRLASQLGPFEWVRVTQRLEQILVTAAQCGQGVSPALSLEQEVLDSGRSIVNNDLTLDEWGGGGPWSSAAAFPLRREGRVWGCLAYYSLRKDAFAPEDTALLQELAEDVAFGLQARDQESRRRESEQFLGDMANLVPGLFYKLQYREREGFRFLYVSPGIDLLLPLSPEAVKADAQKMIRTVHPLDRRKFYRMGLQSLRFLTVFNLEFRLRRPNGTVVWVLSTAFPQRQDDGSVVWTGMAVDVSPQNRLQEALRAERELLTVILNNIGDGVVAIDKNEQLTVVNTKAMALFGVQSQPSVVGHWSRLHAALPWTSTAGFHPWYYTRGDGEQGHLEVQVADLSPQEEQGRGRVMLLRDMDESDRIDERLRQSEKLESIGLLAGGIAHDFNNLLTGVFGFIQLARMNAGQVDKVQAYLDQAQGPFLRARTLTTQLLTFAKGGEPNKKPIDVEQLLRTLLPGLLGDASVRYELQVDSPVWKIHANETQFHQVMENLLINALQALQTAGQVRPPKIVVEVRHHEEPGPEGRGLLSGPYLEVSVSDNGLGIHPGVESKVFDPFFTTKATGTGLGLSICFSVLKKHRGCIEVESIPDQGSRFRTFWPALAVTQPGEERG